MQELYIQDKTKPGKKRMKTVKIIRAWTESEGKQLFLHHNGVYGYKDGSPVKKASELNIITDPIQHKLALRWWNSVGNKLSSQHYARETKKIEDLQMSGVPDMVVSGDVSDLDAITYMRRPVAEKNESAYSDPSTWYEWFENRPEWWGQATMIEIAGYHYSMAMDDEEKGQERVTSDELRETEVEEKGQERVTSDELRETEVEEKGTEDEETTLNNAHADMVSELKQVRANVALDKLTQLTDALGVKFVVENIKLVNEEEFGTLSKKVNKLAADLL